MVSCVGEVHRRVGPSGRSGVPYLVLLLGQRSDDLEQIYLSQACVPTLPLFSEFDLHAPGQLQVINHSQNWQVFLPQYLSGLLSRSR